jgi:hypothetical protein
VKAGLIPVFFNIVAPFDFACIFIEGIEKTGTGTDEEQVS